MFCISKNFDCPIETIRDTANDVVLATTKTTAEKGEAETSKSKQ